MRNQLFVIFGFVCLASPHLCSCQYLYVKSKRNVIYKQGDHISLKLDGRMITGEITSFADSSFYLSDRREIFLNDVDIIFRENPRKRSISNIYTAAAALPIIDLANNGTPIGGNIVTISAILLSSGILLQCLHKKRLRIEHEAQLQIVN